MQPIHIVSTLGLVTAAACLMTFADALPPFEIRSASSRRSEAADDWLRQLQQQYDSCKNSLNGPTLRCSSAGDDSDAHQLTRQCVHASQLCDGLEHCPNGDDEATFLCDALEIYLELDRERQQQQNTLRRTRTINRALG